MANQEHLEILRQGISVWNMWRERYPRIQPDLSGINLEEVNLSSTNRLRIHHHLDTQERYWLLEGEMDDAANFSHANLAGTVLSRAILCGVDFSEANLSNTDLTDADLTYADLNHANLEEADLSGAILCEAILYNANFNHAKLIKSDLFNANLIEANLEEADLNGANLEKACLHNAQLRRSDLRGAQLVHTDLREADLTEADLQCTNLVGTDLRRTVLTGCGVYGISVWDIKLEDTKQSDLKITHYPYGIFNWDTENYSWSPPKITVDNLKVAQFIYLLLNNAEIREVIDTIAKKAVLILGRFTPERKVILDGLREALRTHGYLPMLFDFEKPSSRDFTETVSILAHLSRFVIVDLTSPNSVPYELGTLVHQCIVPFQPILLEQHHEFAMLQDLRRRHDWLLPTHSYRELEDLLASLQTKVIEPSEKKAQELEMR